MPKKLYAVLLICWFVRQGGVAALNAALQSVDRKSVKALSISGQQHGFVPIDQQGQVILLSSDIREDCNLCSLTEQANMQLAQTVP